MDCLVKLTFVRKNRVSAKMFETDRVGLPSERDEGAELKFELNRVLEKTAEQTLKKQRRKPRKMSERMKRERELARERERQRGPT